MFYRANILYQETWHQKIAYLLHFCLSSAFLEQASISQQNNKLEMTNNKFILKQTIPCCLEWGHEWRVWRWLRISCSWLDNNNSTTNSSVNNRICLNRSGHEWRDWRWFRVSCSWLDNNRSTTNSFLNNHILLIISGKRAQLIDKSVS